MENDFSFVYGIVASAFLIIFAIILAKSFKHDDKVHNEKRKKEQEREIFSLARDDELTPEEKQRLIEVMSKKF